MALTQISTAGVKDNAVTSGKIPADAVGASELANDAVDTNAIVNGAVTNAKLASGIDASKITGLTTDAITENNSKVEVVDDNSSSGYVTTVTDGTEVQRSMDGATTIKYLRVGANWNMANTAAAGSTGIAIGDAGNNHDMIASTASNGLHIDSNQIVTIGQNGFPNNTYAAFDNGGCEFNINGVNKVDLDASGLTIKTDILSGTDSTHDIGTTSNRFANVYADTLYGSGANITALNGSAISSGTVPVANIGTGTKNSSTFYRGDGTFAAVTSTTVNNQADNRLITCTGTTDTLNGEANVTYEGHTFTTGLTGITPKFVLKRTGNVDSGDNIFSTLQTHDANGNSMAEITVRRESANDEAYMDFETKATGLGVQGSVRIKGSNGTMYCAGNLGRASNNQPAYFNDEVYGGTTVPSVLSLRTLTNGGETGLLVRGTSQGGGSSSPHSCIRVDATACGNNADQYGIYTRVRQQLVSDQTGYYATVYGSYSTTYCFRGHLDKHLGAYSNGYTFHSKITTSHSGGSAYHFRGDSGTTQKVRIEEDGDLDNANNSYGGLSDVKLKENIVDAGSQWEDIKAIKVRNYNFKKSTGLSTFKQLGVVAQELETVSAGLIKTENDIEIDKSTGEGKVTGVTKSVKYSVLYMKAFKALQEAMARIEVLEAKVA